MVLNRESGLVPLVTSTFEVRAQCGDDLGEWNVISGYIGKWKEVLITISIPILQYNYNILLRVEFVYTVYSL